MAPRPLHTFDVVRTEDLNPHMVRVVFGGPGFDTFAPKEFTDSYVKLVFFPAGVDVDALPKPLTNDSFSGLPAEQQPTIRTFTVRDADPVARELTIDFAIHGHGGVAGPWARAARPGDRLYIMGPNGAYAPNPDADWHLLVGDEAALPAITVALAALPADAVGRVFLETAGPEDVIDLPAPAGVQVNWVFRGGAADEVGDDRSGDNSPVIAAVRAAEWLPGQVHVFIHGEAQTVMHTLRPYIRRERGVPAAWAASISGYWRRGRTEESFKTWKRELAAAEGIDPA
jgi:NADPH-dependent ferric siderophore reductase